jgi:hypothetical protein
MSWKERKRENHFFNEALKLKKNNNSALWKEKKKKNQKYTSRLNLI